MNLTHYTTLENLLSILDVGFVYAPNTRELLQRLLGWPDLEEDPCRGMVCFTDLSIENAFDLVSEFGHFGIAMTSEWVALSNSKKVKYVGERDPENFARLKTTFRSAAPSFQSTGDNELDKWVLSLGLKKPEFAKSLGAPDYARLLDEYAFFQTDEHWVESEWRIMNTHGFAYSKGMDRNEVIRICINLARAGIHPTMKITPKDVAYFICPTMHLSNMRASLPKAWQETGIVPY